MYKCFEFLRLLHYAFGRAIDINDFTIVFGIWHNLCFLCPGSQELRNALGLLTLYSVSLLAEFFLHKTRIF